MSPKLQKLFLVLFIISLLFILLDDAVFFAYVKTFGLRLSIYRQIDTFHTDLALYLIFPVSLALAHLTKLGRLPAKIKIVIYFLAGLIFPFVFFLSTAASFGQLSSEYQTYSSLALNRLYFKLFIFAFFYIYCWAPLLALINLVLKRNRPAAKLFAALLGLASSSLLLAALILGLAISFMAFFLNRHLLPNKVTDTLPQLQNYTNQKIIIADHPQPLLDCYLRQNPADFSTRLLNQIAGASFLNNTDYNSYYLNDHCLVVYLGAPLTLDNAAITKSTAILSELLIRLTFGSQIRAHANKHPSETITVKGEELLKIGANRGAYNSDTNTIEIQKGYALVFETITHELLHSLAVDHPSWLGYSHSGLNEAITQSLTGRVMRYFSAAYSPYIYPDQVAAFEKLTPYLDEKNLLNTYFNGNLQSLQKEVDAKTYPGAFCRFNHYLDRSLTQYVDTRNFDLAAESALKAEKALTSKDGDTFNCLKPN